MPIGMVAADLPLLADVAMGTGHTQVDGRPTTVRAAATEPVSAVQRPANPLVSVIVPVLNEEAAISRFLQAVRPVLEGAQLGYEILFIDDGSTDHSFALLAGMACDDPRIRVISFSRNFGKEAALSAGLDHARGDVLVPIDVDLQDPPELIPALFARWREGFDVVYGIRSDRGTNSFVKRVTAMLFYRLFNRITATELPLDAGDFRLIDRRVADVLRQLPERGRFMKGLFAWVGFRATGVSFERAARQGGTSKFSLWRLWNFALDGITGFSTVPLRIWSYFGSAIALFAFVYALVTVTKTLLFGNDVPGYASLLTVVLFLGGVQMISLGVIGEYLGRMFLEVKARPLYVVGAAVPPLTDPVRRDV